MSVTVAPDIEFVASLEQHAPQDAIGLAALAADRGFTGTSIVDRFQPWLPAQGNASFAWTMLGALGSRTPGSLTVTAVPGYRMHPAAVAQASATTGALYPGRHRLVLAAGDAIDEHVVGRYWPEAAERMTRMFDALDVIRKLFATGRRGSDARHASEFHRLEGARLWTAPTVMPSIQVWAGGPLTARRAGRVADGIVVSAASSDRLEKLVAAAREGAAEAGRRPGDLLLTAHVQLAWAPTDDAALAGALQEWPMAGMRFPRGDIRSPFDVEQLARTVSRDDLLARLPVSADPGVHRAELQRLLDLGFTRLQVHNVLRDQRAWLDVAGAEILPKLSF